MKKLFRNPLFYVDVGLFMVAMMVVGTSQSHAAFFTMIRSAWADVEATITGSGKVNQVAAFTAANKIGDSLIYDNGVSVGIDTGTNVNDKLEVAGNQDQLLRLTHKGSSKPSTIFKQGSDGGLVINNGGINAVTVKSGNVGIGTTNPLGKLDIETPEAVWGVKLLRSGVNVGGLHSNGGILTLQAASGGAYVAVANGGNVGIGTANPVRTLTVSGSSAPAIALNTSATVNKRTSIDYYARDVQQFQTGIDINANNSRNFYIYDAPTNTTRLLIDSIGNVGIGTANPVRKLDVAGDIRISQQIYSPSAYAGFLTDSGVALPVKVGSLAITGSYSDVAPANGLYVVGNVGIGTVSPGYKLDVAGAIKSDTYVRAYQSAPGGDYIFSQSYADLPTHLAQTTSQYINGNNQGVGYINSGLDSDGKYYSQIGTYSNVDNGSGGTARTGTAYMDSYFNGRVYADGYIGTPKFCLNGACITSWAEAGTATVIPAETDPNVADWARKPKNPPIPTLQQVTDQIGGTNTDKEIDVTDVCIGGPAGPCLSKINKPKITGGTAVSGSGSVRTDLGYPHAFCFLTGVTIQHWNSYQTHGCTIDENWGVTAYSEGGKPVTCSAKCIDF